MGKLGTKLKKLREGRNMSLQDVATCAALSKAHVWEIETGGSINPTIETICCLAIALHADADELAALATEDCMKTIKIEPQTQSFVVRQRR